MIKRLKYALSSISENIMVYLKCIFVLIIIFGNVDFSITLATATARTTTRLTSTTTTTVRSTTPRTTIKTSTPVARSIPNNVRVSIYTGPLIGVVETSNGINSSYIYDVYSSPPTRMIITNTTAGQTGLIFVHDTIDSFLFNGQRLPIRPTGYGISSRQRSVAASTDSCTNFNNNAVRTRTPISCNDVANSIDRVCLVLGDPDFGFFDSVALTQTICLYFSPSYPQCVAALTGTFLAARIACDVYSIYHDQTGNTICNLLPTAPPASTAQAPSIPACDTTESTCCKMYNNCPGETGSQCSIGCCCCPSDQRCCADNSGCCPST